jgi:hypothetical protein
MMTITEKLETVSAEEFGLRIAKPLLRTNLQM